MIVWPIESSVSGRARNRPSDVLRMARPAQPEYCRRGEVMTAPVTVRERDLRALAGIVSEDRPDVPTEEGRPPSLLADLMGQVRCDGISLERHDSGRQETWFLQLIPVIHSCAAPALQPVHWQYYWHCQQCSYPDRTGDLRSIVHAEGQPAGRR
jgi:hypothetical protein